MREIRIKLDLCKARRMGAIADREAFFAKYGNDKRDGYTMLSGTPQLVSVEGTLVKTTMLPSLATTPRAALIASRWVSALKHPETSTPPCIVWQWSR